MIFSCQARLPERADWEMWHGETGAVQKCTQTGRRQNNIAYVIKREDIWQDCNVTFSRQQISMPFSFAIERENQPNRHIFQTTLIDKTNG